MDQEDRVGQNHGERDHMNNIFSDMLPSLIARKKGYWLRLLESSRHHPPTAQTKGKGVADPELLSAIFLFWDFSSIPKIKWTKSEE